MSVNATSANVIGDIITARISLICMGGVKVLGVATFNNITTQSLATSVISENIPGGGVTVFGNLIPTGNVTLSPTSVLSTNIITPVSPGTQIVMNNVIVGNNSITSSVLNTTTVNPTTIGGTVTIAGVMMQNNTVNAISMKTTNIMERTPGTGINIMGDINMGTNNAIYTNLIDPVSPSSEIIMNSVKIGVNSVTSAVVNTNDIYVQPVAFPLSPPTTITVHSDLTTTGHIIVPNGKNVYTNSIVPSTGTNEIGRAHV